MEISALDHIVITVHDMEKTIGFYTEILGMKEISFEKGRKALAFGTQKINIHQANSEINPVAGCPTPGSADLCFLAASPLDEIVQHLHKKDIPIELGPIARTGATGKIISIYVRDPDRNLIEIANRVS